MANESKGAEIARAYVLVIPSTQGAQKRLTEELVPEAEKASHEAGTKGGEKFKAALGTAAKAAAAVMAAAVAGSVALIKQSLDAAAESEQLQGGITKLFGDEAAVKVIEHAAKAYKTAGVSATAYMKTLTPLAASILASGVSASEAADLADQALRQMADNANTFGVRTTEEIGQIYAAIARGQYATLDSLSLGYAGTKEGMQALIRDANAYAAATGRAADMSIDNYGDIIKAIGLIQEKIGISETTVKEAEGTISGSLSMLSAAWQNLIAGFGDPAADVDTLVDRVMSSLDAALNTILPTVVRITNSLIRALPNLVSQVLSVLPSLLPTMLESIVDIAKAIAEELPNILNIIITTLTDNADMLIDAAIDIALALVNAVPQILNALGPAIPKIVNSLVSSLVEHIPDFIAAAIEIVAALVENSGEIIAGIIENIPYVVEKLVEAFEDPKQQQKMVEAGKVLGQAILNGILGKLIPGLGSWSDRIASATASVPDYSGMKIDLGSSYTGAATGGNYTVGTVNITNTSADSGQTLMNKLSLAASLSR